MLGQDVFKLNSYFNVDIDNSGMSITLTESHKSRGLIPVVLVVQVPYNDCQEVT